MIRSFGGNPAGTMLREVLEENQTRKILEILKEATT